MFWLDGWRLGSWLRRCLVDSRQKRVWCCAVNDCVCICVKIIYCRIWTVIGIHSKVANILEQLLTTIYNKLCQLHVGNHLLAYQINPSSSSFSTTSIMIITTHLLLSWQAMEYQSRLSQVWNCLSVVLYTSNVEVGTLNIIGWVQSPLAHFTIINTNV